MPNTKENKDVIEALINEVRERPIIFSLQHPDHKDGVKIQQAWFAIRDALAVIFDPDVLKKAKVSTVEEIKNKFGNLRSGYRKEKKNRQAPSGSGRDSLKKGYCWFESLRFLDCNNALEVQFAIIHQMQIIHCTLIFSAWSRFTSN